MEDKYKVILTVHKGVAMVVLDKHDYLNKVQDLLEGRYAYQPILGTQLLGVKLV